MVRCGQTTPDLEFASAGDVLRVIQLEFGVPRLSLELIPKSTWGLNLRSLLLRSDWDKLRFPTYAAAGNRCEICGGTGKRGAVHCHEIWSFADGPCVQRLLGLIALCPTCHAAKHFGRSIVEGFATDVQEHLSEINAWTRAETLRYIDLELTLWQIRSRREWDLDLTWLSRFRIGPTAKSYLRRHPLARMAATVH